MSFIGYAHDRCHTELNGFYVPCSKVEFMDVQSAIDDFFDQYSARLNCALWEGQFDPESTMQAFADEFIGASPLGIRSGKNDASFKEAISKGWSSYRELGINSMNILSKDITLLDGLHALVKVKWNCLYVTKTERTGEIEFEVFYLLQMRAGSLKIFAYITGDEQQAFKDAGLL
jgi:hypothetical protein